MAENNKVLINLATGLEDTEPVTVALLVATAALNAGKHVGLWLTKEAVRLALPEHAQGLGCDGCPPLELLMEQFATGGGERAAPLPDLPQGPQTERRQPRRERTRHGRNPTLGVDWRGSDGIQLLTR